MKKIIFSLIFLNFTSAWGVSIETQKSQYLAYAVQELQMAKIGFKAQNSTMQLNLHILKNEAAGAKHKMLINAFEEDIKLKKKMIEFHQKLIAQPDLIPSSTEELMRFSDSLKVSSARLKQVHAILLELQRPSWVRSNVYAHNYNLAVISLHQYMADHNNALLQAQNN